jgi:hypothetical protein
VGPAFSFAAPQSTAPFAPPLLHLTQPSATPDPKLAPSDMYTRPAVPAFSFAAQPSSRRGLRDSAKSLTSSHAHIAHLSPGSYHTPDLSTLSRVRKAPSTTWGRVCSAPCKKHLHVHSACASKGETKNAGVHDSVDSRCRLWPLPPSDVEVGRAKDGLAHRPRGALAWKRPENTRKSIDARTTAPLGHAVAKLRYSAVERRPPGGAFSKAPKRLLDPDSPDKHKADCIKLPATKSPQPNTTAPLHLSIWESGEVTQDDMTRPRHPAWAFPPSTTAHTSSTADTSVNDWRLDPQPDVLTLRPRLTMGTVRFPTPSTAALNSSPSIAVTTYNSMEAWTFLQRHVPTVAMSAANVRWPGGVTGALSASDERAVQPILLDLDRAWGAITVPPRCFTIPPDWMYPKAEHESHLRLPSMALYSGDVRMSALSLSAAESTYCGPGVHPKDATSFRMASSAPVFARMPSRGVEESGNRDPGMDAEPPIDWRGQGTVCFQLVERATHTADFSRGSQRPCCITVGVCLPLTFHATRVLCESLTALSSKARRVPKSPRHMQMHSSCLGIFRMGRCV